MQKAWQVTVLDQLPDRPWQATAYPGIDTNSYCHASAKSRHPGRLLDLNVHRDTLYHLYPIAGRILRWQHGEFSPGCRRNRRHDPWPFKIRIGIGYHVRPLIFSHPGQLGFLEVRFDPQVVGDDDAENWHTLLYILARLQLHVADNASCGRVDIGILQTEPGLVVRRFGLEVARVALRRQRWIAQ